MSRILEHKSSGEEEVVSRILIQIHRAVDEHFPDAMAASRQFSKTVFSENESTAIVRAPAPDSGNEEPTEPPTAPEDSPNRDLPELDIATAAQEEEKAQKAPKHATPPPPQPRTKTKKPRKVKAEKEVSDLRSRVATQLPDGELETGIKDDTSYGEIVFWGAMLVAGLILLAYVLFVVMG